MKEHKKEVIRNKGKTVNTGRPAFTKASKKTNPVKKITEIKPDRPVKNNLRRSRSVKTSATAPGNPFPQVTITSKIRSIGNSKGIILPSQLIKPAGISPDADLTIQAYKGSIVVRETKVPSRINTDLASWDAQLKKTIEEGNRPEGDLWEGIPNKFDEEEWQA